MCANPAGTQNADDDGNVNSDKVLRRELERKERQLTFIRKVTSILTKADLPLSEKLQQSLWLILYEIRARNGSIMLLDDDAHSLEVVAATREDLIGRKQPLSPDSISGHVFKTKSPLLIEDIADDDRFPARSNYSTASLLSVPMFSIEEERLIGVINASDHEEELPFSSENLEMVVNYASWISPLLENSCLMARIREEKNRYMETAEELRLKQKEIMIASTERTELVEMVVHDFKSPLAAIISNLDLLRYVGLEEEQAPIVQTALEGSKKLLDMINDFLEIARLDHFQKESGQLKPVDMFAILQDVLEELSPLAGKKAIHFQIQDADELHVLGEENLLTHLLQNLLSNAIKYTPEEGTIKVEWSFQPSQRHGDIGNRIILFCIEDSGVGVPDSLKSEIFQKFRRGSRKIDFDIEGSGIGLFICHKIVTILRGKIWVEDAHPQGSRFCFTLFSPDRPTPVS